MIRRALWTAALVGSALLLPSPSARADNATIELMNDEVLSGDLLYADAQTVVLQVEGRGVLRIDRRTVRDIKLAEGFRMPRPPIGPRGASGASGGSGASGRSGPSGVTGGSGGAPGVTGLGAPSGAGGGSGILPPPAIPVGSQPSSGLGSSFDDAHIALRLPDGFRAEALGADATTFEDGRGARPWTFNVTYFNGRDEGDFPSIRSAAQSRLERIDGYSVERREPAAVGGRVAERTVGVFERGGRVIRHDQLVIETPTGVLVIHFFSPGATLEAGAVPEVEAVIRTIRLK